jgi:hypothetical protein
MSQLLNRLLRKKVEPEKPLLEQLKEQIDLAEEFDRLQAFPAWEKVLRYMGTEVNSELTEATRYKYDPVKQQVHVIGWNAKRELLDKTLAFMESAQNERDRIIEEYREMQNARDNNGDRTETS